MSIDSSPGPAPREGPHTLVILFAVAIALALIAPWIPAGYFEPGAPIAMERFRIADAAPPLSLFAGGEGTGLLNVPFEGLASGGRDSAAVGVIALLLIVGGAFAVVTASGAVDRGLARLIALSGGRPAWLLGSLFVACSLGGAVFGMGEETIAFLALLLPLTDRLGLPRECAVMCTTMASQIGFATSWMNPFSVAVAQGIAELPLLSGAGFRIALWSAFTLAGLGFTLWYARRHRSTARTDHAQLASTPEIAALNWADRAILIAIAATVAWIVWGVTVRGYYLPEIATQFFTLGLVAGFIAWLDRRLSVNRIAEQFVDGARALMPVVLVIGVAKGLVWLLGGTDPHQPTVLNSVLYAMAWCLDGAPSLLAAQGMLLLQSVFNFFVTSGSAQAAITMPLMAGLGDLVGVTRQVAVLAFQLGDGITNLVVPTSAVLLGALGVAGLTWQRWIAVIWRFFLLLMLGSALAVGVAVLTGFS